MSDLHLPADGELLWGEDCRRKFLTAVGQIKEMQDIHAIIVSGDISNDGNIDSYIYADQVFAELNIPTFGVQVIMIILVSYQPHLNQSSAVWMVK